MFSKNHIILYSQTRRTAICLLSFHLIKVINAVSTALSTHPYTETPFHLHRLIRQSVSGALASGSSIAKMVRTETVPSNCRDRGKLTDSHQSPVDALEDTRERQQTLADRHWSWRSCLTERDHSRNESGRKVGSELRRRLRSPNRNSETRGRVQAVKRDDRR